MRWFSALLLLALAGLPGSAQVAGVDGPIEPGVIAAPAPPANPDPCLRVEADYLYWFLRDMRVPALLTTGTPNPAGVVGALGDPGTTVLYGNGPIDTRFGRAIGLQLRGNVWLDDLQTIGLHGPAFFLERDSSNFTVPHGAIAPLARPYIDANNLAPQAELIGGDIPGFGPGLGGFNAYSRTELFGQDLNALAALVQHPDYQLNLLLGGRFLQMRERLDITATTKVGPNLDGVLGETDHIHTFNKFFGLQGGVLGEVRLLDRLSLTGKGTFALGENIEEIKNNGDRTIDTPATGRVMLPYGLYVLPSNTGTFQKVAFNTVWETSLTLNYQLTGRIVLRVGYSFLGWEKPIRPGQQITPINLSQVSPAGLSGPEYPIVPFIGSWFLAQGGQAGLEFRW